ncbi:MAG: 50S ribosomal protein L11 methyltransferase [Alphaproteobacteria bacterium]|nr:50S ribosomal protein L11 methyltransferase [Alphaproteobacteria bacterium]
MSMLWCLGIRIHYRGIDAAVQLLEDMDMQAISWCECDDALPSLDIDDQGFPIASEFFLQGYSKHRPQDIDIQRKLDTLAALLEIPVPVFTIEEVDNADWLSVCYQQLEPRQLGRYYVYGSHNPDPADDNLIPLRIDAATAFGSGEHPTTSGCLLALDGLANDHQFSKMLDMGCGSGILAIAMAKTWPHAKVLGVDNDPESVRVTQQNAILNSCGRNLEALMSEGFADLRVYNAGPFEVVTANILAKPLCMMAPDVKDCLVPGGLVILSGLLDRQKSQVLEAYEVIGFTLVKTYPIEDWATLVLKRG